MTKKIKLNYDQAYATQHSRDYYRGKSFHFSNKWVPGVHYVSDDYNIDFVVHGQCLLACAKSHLSTVDNEPTQYIYNSNGDICGVASTYWDFVIGSVSGASPGVKIIDNYWWICDNVSVPEEEQIWVNTGVKAKMELSDLTPEEIELLQRPGKEVVEDFMNNVIVQTTGNNQDKLMSQDCVTKELRLIDLVTSEHLTLLHKQVQNLIDNIDTLGNATAISLSLSEMLRINDSELIRIGTSSPSFVPDFIGQFYNDTNAKLPYIALGNSSASDWIALATKSSLDTYKSEAATIISGINSAISSANQRITNNSTTISSEVTRLEGLISSEATTRRTKDSNLEDMIAQEADTRQRNDNVILNKIPAEATSDNKLADKAYVQDLVSTSSATFRGTYSTLAELQQQEADLNDYGFVQWIDQAGNVIYSRYKYDGTIWKWEYDQTNTQFTVIQQAAIDSGINSSLVTKLTELPTNTQLQNNYISKINDELSIYGAKTFLDPIQISNTNNYPLVISSRTTLLYPEGYVIPTGIEFRNFRYDEILGRLKINAVDGDFYRVNSQNQEFKIYDEENFASLKSKLDGIAAGAQVNVLEGVTVNNTDLPISNKKVNIDLTNYQNLISDLATIRAGAAAGATAVQDSNYIHTDNNYTTTEKTKLSNIADGAQVNLIEQIQINGVTQTITNKIVNLPAYPTTLPASDVYAWAKAATKPTYTPSEIGAATSAQGSLADSAIQTIQINGTVQTKTNGIVNLPAYPTTLPASDVYSWAKASTKPSYTFAEITSKPTTISGYGITDAHITNGVITIGNNTITPLTSFTESDPTVPTWAKASSKPTYNLDEVSDGTTRKLSDYKTIASLQSKGNVNIPIYFDSNGNAQIITGLTLDGELSGNSFKVIAEHLSRLTSRIKNLEDVLDTANDLVANSVDSAKGYYRNGDKTILTGSGAPTVVPAFIGQFYINTSGPALYYAVGNSATSDWKQA